MLLMLGMLSCGGASEPEAAEGLIPSVSPAATPESSPTQEVEAPTPTTSAAEPAPPSPADEYCQLARVMERRYKQDPNYAGLRTDVERLNSISDELTDVFRITAFGAEDTFFGSNPSLTPKQTFFQLRHVCDTYN